MSKEKLWEVLNTDRAKSHYAAIARITGRQSQEAGFVVYRSGQEGPYEVSDLVESRDTEHYREHPGLTAVDAMMLPHTIDFGDLCLREPGYSDAPIDYRNDLALVLHSHVTSGMYTLSDASWLCPSVIDIESWDDAKTVNPGIVEAVSIVKGSLLRMLLYRQQPEQPGVPYYHQLTGDEPDAQVLRVLTESGVSTADLAYDLRARSFTPESSGAFQSLFDAQV